MTVYCENNEKKYTNKPCWKNSDFVVINLVAHVKTTVLEVVN